MKDGDNVRHFRVKQVDGNKLKLQGVCCSDEGSRHLGLPGTIY
jgi:hypothetical protein